MLFLTINDNNEVSSIHHMPFDEKYGLNKTVEELQQEGVLVENIPKPEQIEGKIPLLKYNGAELYYEYEDAPIDEVTKLKNKLDIQEQQLQEQSVSIAELTTLIATMSV